jgi:predicted DCC family thiol-disulfide oxidoreductase YuxK
LFVYDGGCPFCRRWVRRLRRVTGGRVLYAPYQEAAERFPEIPRGAFIASVQYIQTDGRVYSGAAAAYKVLSRNPALRWLYPFYRLPGVGAVSETLYDVVSRHRHSL